MVKNKKFYLDKVVFGTIALVLITGIVSTTTISAPVPAAARPPTDDDGCNIGSDGVEPDDVFVEGEPHGTTNDNGRHITCHGEPSPIPTSGGAIVDETESGDTRCHGVSTPSGQGQFTCNTNFNRK